MDGRCRPLSLIVIPGQRADCTQFKPVLEKTRVPRFGPGRPRKKPDSVAADKTPHAAIGSSGRCERRQDRCGEGDRFVESLAGCQAMMQLAEHAVEQAAKGGVVAIADVSSPVVVSMGSR